MNGPTLALAVALAGGAGAVLRFLVDRLTVGLWLVNVTGSFALGWIIGATTTDAVQSVVGTGFLGGYTTFSAASLVAAEQWIRGRRPAGILGVVAMTIACAAAASLGHLAGTE